MLLSSSPPIPILSLQPSLPPPLSSISPQLLCAPDSLLSRRAALSLLGLSPVLNLPLPLPVYAVENTLFDDPEREEDRVVRLFRDVSPSVVFIKDLVILSNSGKAGSNLEQREEDDEWGSVKVEGTGSGFVWDKAVHIVTNYHVIAKLASDNSGNRRCKVYLEDLSGSTFSKEGKLIGSDPSYDLAVLKVDVDSDRIIPAPIGSSNDLRVGQSCYAIGNPYGYEHTLTTGVVSGLGRQIPSPNGRPIRGAIQTDAAINAGNSGGPLIDSHGHVIGVNTSTFTRQGTGISSGVNFAIPIDSVVQTVPYLIVYGKSVSNRF